MATFYSNFFSSGLLAAQHSPRPANTPRSSSPTTPRPPHAALAPEDTTPTGPAIAHDVFSTDESQVLPSISVAAPSASTSEGDSRPRLRRRRSSLAGAASPLATMKTSAPMRQAASSVQRQNLTLRARAGSDASILSTATASSVSSFGAAGVENAPASSSQRPSGIIGRLRSGSLGTALLRPRRGLRRAAPPMPAPPPPTAPLPEVPPPSSPTMRQALPTITASPSQPTTPRRPLARRSQTCDNYDLTASPFSVAGASPMCVTDDEDAFAAACAGLPSSPGYALGGAGKGPDGMQVDYPSPVDGAPFDWDRRAN
ncbi:hypothetical protein PYCCODRAFT_796235 [Trametes coccinea BRFM310]|uniref:Uncharacterized protein n=1 Tax=Trametes coccinea (strain BRFM310) TaxID=1353009 RepID=A0A1Y2J131_TRAC3|nr:hypothetical protein PYCCODRAFT_796235 [Trametes coccinea BRFM310]